MGFDIDACCCGFNGERAFVLPRTRRAINKEYCLVDMSRRSLTYETRLYKYSLRGFAVAVPDFDRAKVDQDLFTKRLQDVNGLAKLLLLEYRLLYGKKTDTTNNTANQQEAPSGRRSRRRRARRPRGPRQPRTSIKREMKTFELKSLGLDDEDADKTKSDYSDISIPWYELYQLISHF
jgi:hypothetical protein